MAIKKAKTKEQLTREVATRTKYLKTPVGEIIEALEDIMSESIINGETIRFSCFEIGNKVVPPMKGINPKSGEPYISKEHTVPYAKIRPTFKSLYRELNEDEK